MGTFAGANAGLNGVHETFVVLDRELLIENEDISREPENCAECNAKYMATRQARHILWAVDVILRHEKWHPGRPKADWPRGSANLKVGR